MELSKERLERLRELLAPAHQQIVIVSHTNPDGDAVGSSLAWAEALRSMGHEVTCVVPNKYPYFLDWMQGIEEVVVFKNDTEGRAARAIADADILFCLDFNDVSRSTTTFRPTRVSTFRSRIPIRRAPAFWSTPSSKRCSARRPLRAAWPKRSMWAS